MVVKRIFRYFKGIYIYGLFYRRGGQGKFILAGYTDVDWVSDSDTRKSLFIYCFLLVSAVVNWFCKKQSFIVLLFTEAEYKFFTDVFKEAE